MQSSSIYTFFNNYDINSKDKRWSVSESIELVFKWSQDYATPHNIYLQCNNELKVSTDVSVSPGIIFLIQEKDVQIDLAAKVVDGEGFESTLRHLHLSPGQKQQTKGD